LPLKARLTLKNRLDKTEHARGTHFPTWPYRNELHIYMKNGVFWNVMPCGSCKNRRFGGI
jgi:hypothetical protein